MMFGSAGTGLDTQDHRVPPSPPFPRQHGQRPSISTARIVDSLAEITRYQDRELLERSLATTLAEIFPDDEFWLYRVVEIEAEMDFALLAYASRGTIGSEASPRAQTLPPELLEAMVEAVTSRAVVERDNREERCRNIVYPVFDKHESIYCVLLQRSAQSNFDAQRLTYGLLRIYSNYLALLEESRRDKLTNLFNREMLDIEITRKIVSHSQRKRHPEAHRRAEDDWLFWLCIIDVDHFKRINDEWGHLYGDEVLILLARQLETIFRDEDLIFRYGGEEFVALFSTLDIEDAASICERVRTRIAQHHFPNVGHITVSIGMTEIRDQNGTAEAIDQADKALYYAKEQGRDQVHFYARLIEQGLLEDHARDQMGSVDFF